MKSTIILTDNVAEQQAATIDEERMVQVSRGKPEANVERHDMVIVYNLSEAKRLILWGLTELARIEGKSIAEIILEGVK